MQRTAEILQLAGEEARRIASTGEFVPIDAVPRGEGRIGLTRRFPVGTVLAITPFNAPLLLVAHKLGPGVRGRLSLHRPARVEDAALGALARARSCSRRARRRRGQRRPVRDRARRADGRATSA